MKKRKERKVDGYRIRVCNSCNTGIYFSLDSRKPPRRPDPVKSRSRLRTRTRAVIRAGHRAPFLTYTDLSLCPGNNPNLTFAIISKGL